MRCRRPPVGARHRPRATVTMVSDAIRMRLLLGRCSGGRCAGDGIAGGVRFDGRGGGFGFAAHAGHETGFLLGSAAGGGAAGGAAGHCFC